MKPTDTLNLSPMTLGMSPTTLNEVFAILPYRQRRALVRSYLEGGHENHSTCWDDWRPCVIPACPFRVPEPDQTGCALHRYVVEEEP